MYWYLKGRGRTMAGIERQRGTWGSDTRLITPRRVLGIEHRLASGHDPASVRLYAHVRGEAGRRRVV